MKRRTDSVYIVLRLFMRELRSIFKRRSRAYYVKFPDAGRPCKTCAFNPATDDWNGWDTTAYGVMKAIRDDTPFYCHEGIPWKTPIEEWTPEQIKHFEETRQLCSGWVLVYGDPRAKIAFARAAVKADAFELAPASIPGAGEILKKKEA
ncbi:MAG: hypothetical protein IH921_05775 [Gemmatimonadetes bacterium]|nr:hypothetical protein [Gemmatimonadota bacterium]